MNLKEYKVNLKESRENYMQSVLDGKKILLEASLLIRKTKHPQVDIYHLVNELLRIREGIYLDNAQSKEVFKSTIEYIKTSGILNKISNDELEKSIKQLDNYIKNNLERYRGEER